MLTEQAVSKTCMTYTYWCVYSTRLLIMDGKAVRNMESSIPKINLIKLVHLVGVVIRIYHDARSSDEYNCLFHILIRSNKMQQYAGIYLLQNHSKCFGCLSHPSSGVHRTVTAASGTGHITYQGNDLLPAWPN